MAITFNISSSCPLHISQFIVGGFFFWMVVAVIMGQKDFIQEKFSWFIGWLVSVYRSTNRPKKCMNAGSSAK